MRLNKCCTAALLSLLSVNLAYGGALKGGFTKGESGHIQPATDKGKDSTDTVSEESAVDSAEIGKSSETEEKANPEPVLSQESKSEKEGPKKIEGDPIVIKVGKEEVRRSKILKEIAKLPPQIVKNATPNQLFIMARDQLASTYVMEKHAKKAGLDKSKEFVERLDELKLRVLVDLLLAKETGTPPNESALKARYTKYLVEFVKRKESNVFHIVVDSEQKCKELIEKLKKGADFKKLAREHSLYKDHVDEGSWFAIDILPEQLKTPLKKLKNGEFSKEPVKFGTVWGIFKIDGVRDSQPLKYDDAKGMLAQLIMQEKLRDFILSLMKKYDVKVFKEDGTADAFSMSAPMAP